MMSGNQSADDMPQSPTPRPNPDAMTQSKRAGMICIGVLAPTNRSSENVSINNLQSYLAQKLTVGNIEGIAIGNEADARSAGCDYLLTSDLSKLKQSTASKIGGLFGKVTSTDTSAAQKFDAQVDFKLVLLKNGQSVMQNKAAAKIEGDADRAAQGILAQEASAVLAVAK